MVNETQSYKLTLFLDFNLDGLLKSKANRVEMCLEKACRAGIKFLNQTCRFFLKNYSPELGPL